jgi:hypothetical protein
MSAFATWSTFSTAARNSVSGSGLYFAAPNLIARIGCPLQTNSASATCAFLGARRPWRANRRFFLDFHVRDIGARPQPSK